LALAVRSDNEGGKLANCVKQRSTEAADRAANRWASHPYKATHRLVGAGPRPAQPTIRKEKGDKPHNPVKQ
jgi:hypothetical protein